MTNSPTNLENAERAEMTMTPHAYAQEYEFRGDTDYTPNDGERTMIEDAIIGYLAAQDVEPPLTCPHIDAAIESGEISPQVLAELFTIRDINSQLRYGTWALKAKAEAAEARASALEQKLKVAERQLQKAREAVMPLAILAIPKNPIGNAGAYSIRHSDILRARSIIQETDQ